MAPDFKQILSEQKEELPMIKHLGWVPREREDTVSTESRLIQIVTGVRRSGKSTLIHRILNGLDYAYVNFDDERLMNMVPEDLNKMLESLYLVHGEFNKLVLDEIQNVEGWHLFVNRLQRNNIHLYLTGSNSKILSSESATHLTGRYSLIELLPFSFREFLLFHKVEVQEAITAKTKGLLSGLLEKYMANGGFPEIVSGEVKTGYVSTLFDAIVTRDILFRHKIRHVRPLREMAFWLAANPGSEISYNRLKKLFSLGSDNTARNYIFYLEEAWLFLCLPKFSFKKQESLRYRKIYLIDNAFAAVGGSGSSPNKGRLIENLVFLDLFRRRQKLNFELFYYKNITEVDFVIYQDHKVKEMIQVTLAMDDQKTFNREVKALLSGAEVLNPEKLTIITLNDSNELSINGKTIIVKSLLNWLLDPSI